MIDAVLELFRSGLAVVPLKPRAKNPVIDKWQYNRVKSEDHVRQLWAGKNNIGVILGSHSRGLHDLDLDAPEVIPFADILFGHLPGFGREGKPRSHRLVFIKNMKKGKLLYQHGGETFAEVRGDGHQTMFPPSVHPSGETVEWFKYDGIVPEMSHEEVDAHMRVCCAMALLLRHYPQVSGVRDELCMAITGVLVRVDGLNDCTIDSLITTLAEEAGDEEASARGGKATKTRARIERGMETTGLTRAAEMLGLDDEARKTLGRWVGTTGSGGGIVIAEGRLNQILRQAEEAMQARGPVVYEHGTELVRVVRQDRPDPTEDAVRRNAGALRITPVTRHCLVQNWAQSIPWLRLNGKGDLRLADPPLKYAEHYLARSGERNVPYLSGIIHAPTLRADGSLLDQPGYDEATGLIYDPRGVQFPAICQDRTTA